MTREIIVKVHVTREFYRQAGYGEILSFPSKFVTREILSKEHVTREFFLISCMEWYQDPPLLATLFVIV